MAHAGRRRRRAVRAGGGDRHPARDRLHAVGDGRVGVGRVHPGPADARVVRARPAQLRLVGADRRRRPSPAASPAVRRLPAPARAQLDGGAGAVWRRRAVRAVGLPPALGPEGLLGEAGRGDDRGQRPDRRRPDAEADPGRRRVRQPDVDPRLRVPRDGVACVADRPAGAAHLPVPAAWLHAKVVAVAAGRRGARRPRLAGPGGPQRRRRRAGVGRGRRRGHRAPRRAAGIAGRSDVQLPRPPRVVRAAAVPAAHVLRGAAGDRRDDDHPWRRHGAGVRAAVPRSRADEPPVGSAAGAGRRRRWACWR